MMNSFIINEELCVKNEELCVKKTELEEDERLKGGALMKLRDVKHRIQGKSQMVSQNHECCILKRRIEYQKRGIVY